MIVNRKFPILIYCDQEMIDEMTNKSKEINECSFVDNKSALLGSLSDEKLANLQNLSLV